jgi:hypothetical protein
MRYLALAGLLGLSAADLSQARADSVIVGYYHSDTLVNYANASDPVYPSPAAGGYVTTGVTPEGVGWLMGGPGDLSNVLLVGNPSSGYVELVNAATGAIIDNKYMTAPGGGSFSSLAGMALSSNGQDLYITQSSGSNTGIYEYNTATGKEVGFVSFADAHDVTFHDGYLYATAYQSTSTSSEGIWRFNANLTGATQVVAGGDNGLTHATGMAFNGNTLYVGNVSGSSISSGTGASFVSQYTLSNSGTSATFDQSFINSTTGQDANYLLNPFGVTYYDGSVYVSSLGNLGNDHGQITAINATTGDLTDYIPYSNDNQVAPKYISFESQCVTYSAVPEPASLVLVGLGMAGVGIHTLIRRRRAVVA